MGECNCLKHISTYVSPVEDSICSLTWASTKILTGLTINYTPDNYIKLVYLIIKIYIKRSKSQRLCGFDVSGFCNSSHYIIIGLL